MKIISFDHRSVGADELADAEEEEEDDPGLYSIIADCAYTPTEHLVPINRGDTAKGPRYDNSTAMPG